MQESHVRDLLSMGQLDNRGCYLQAKAQQDMVLYPELACHKKVKRGDKSLWPGEAQLWVITKVCSIWYNSYMLYITGLS